MCRRSSTRTFDLASKTVSADQGNPIGTLKNLWPYMWPADRPDLKMRVLWATLFLLLSKIVLITVPYFFKWATDALNGEFSAPGWLPVGACHAGNAGGGLQCGADCAMGLQPVA
jgi:hypothetical protein